MIRAATVVILLAVLSLSIPYKEAICMTDLNGKKIVMIISHKDFRDEELTTPLQIFKKGGADVKIASSSLGMAQGKLGMSIKVDMLYSDIDAAEYDAVVFVGGPGSVQYWNDLTAHKIAKDAVDKGKVLAAICAAPATLANAGVLKGKRATCFPSEKDQLVAGQAKYTGKEVEVDGNIVTGDGPQSAKAFADAIVKLLTQ
jgi:protease I